jgi:hypothetical protein
VATHPSVGLNFNYNSPTLDFINISVTLHDFYATSTFLFTVSELAKGGELFEQLNRVVTFSEKRTRQIMRQL